MPWRCPITLNTGTLYPGGAVTDWPRVVPKADLPSTMFDADGPNPALSDGGDVFFTLDGTTATQIPVDLVFFSTNNNPALGTAEIWVVVPGSSTATIYVHWNDTQVAQPARNSTYGGDAVWSNDFGAVWRAWTDPSGASPQILDRTGNARDAYVSAGAPIADTRAGLLSPAWVMTTGDRIDYSPLFLVGTYSAWTISMLLHFDSAATNFGMYGEGNFPGPYLAHYTALADLHADYRWGGGGDIITSTAAGAVTTADPMVIDFIRNGNDGANLPIYIDSVDATTASSGTGAPSTIVANPVETYIAANLIGAISLVAVSTVARDSAWLEAWSIMLLDPTTGITVGTPEQYGVFSPAIRRRPILSGGR